MEGTEAQILVAAQERAIEILDHARDAAELQRVSARADAAAILLGQQDRAKELLLMYRARAERLSQESNEAAQAHSADVAAALLQGQRFAAEELESSERRIATLKRDAVESAAVEHLLTAHREAAAVLLEARMAVEQIQTKQGS